MFSDILTMLVVKGNIAVLMQKFLHSANGHSRCMRRIFQLQEALQVRGCVAAANVHTLAVSCIKSEYSAEEKAVKNDFLKKQNAS